MIVLITGSTGLLGKALVKTCARDHDLFTLSRSCHGVSTHIGHDLTQSLCDRPLRPDLIIHCAAEGSVDSVQTCPYLGVDNIIKATINIARFAAERESKLVYISSNAVYDGKSPPYDDDSPLCPINTYGKYKEICETIVRTSLSEYLIVRPMLLYGMPGDTRSNVVATMIDRLRTGQHVMAATDVYAQPILDADCAKLIWEAIDSLSNTAINIAGPESLSIHQIASIIGDVIGNQHLITKCSIKDVATAPRPVDSSFSLRKMNSLSHKPLRLRDGIRTLL